MKYEFPSFIQFNIYRICSGQKRASKREYNAEKALAERIANA
jgi:uncharacterized membrane protein